MVVSGSPIASEVGRDILRQGGNAVDAAVAVGFALAVVHPEAGNLGGGGFMVIRLRDGTVHALDYRETAPSGASRDMYLDSAGQPTDRSLTGPLAAGVPGSVAGMLEAHRKLGHLPVATSSAPAIRLAREGFRVDQYRTNSIRSDSARLALFPGVARRVFSPAELPRSRALPCANRTSPRRSRRFGTAGRPGSIAAGWPISSWPRWPAAMD